jgi:AcrR family transcriptional regulator
MPTRTPAAQRALEVAGALFYERGITATGVDLIAAESGVAKTTMYAHFGNKEALVAAYLQARGEAWRSHLRTEVAARATTPHEQLIAIFDVLGEWMDGLDFRGCPFIKAAGELCDPNHPGLTATSEHRTWLRGYLTDLTQQAGARDAAALASSLLMLYDAAIVHGALDHSNGAAAQRARAAAQTLLDAACK